MVVEDGRPEAWDLTDEVAEDPKALGPLVDWLEEQFSENERSAWRGKTAVASIGPITAATAAE